MRAERGTATPDLRSCIALVTGSSRGVGRGIASALGDAGATVYVTGRSSSLGSTTEGLPGTVEETAAVVSQRGGTGIAVVCDHFDDDQVEALFDRIGADHGRLDLLVNNAWGGYERMGEVPFHAPFWKQPAWRWDLFARSLRSQFTASCLAVPLMVDRDTTRIIVNVGYSDGDTPLGQTAYDVSKHASDRMIRSMAVELSKHGVTALALHPGFVRTERVNAAWDLIGEGPAQVAHSAEYVGRAIVALTADPDVFALSGRTLAVGDLAQTYAFEDIDGRRPPAFHIEGPMSLARRMDRLNLAAAKAGIRSDT